MLMPGRRTTPIAKRLAGCLLACLCLASTLQCRTGNDQATSGGDNASSPPGSDPSGLSSTKLLKGRLRLGESDLAAQAWRVWLVDTTAADLFTLSSDQQGSFALPLSKLLPEHTYALHLLTQDYTYVAAFDLDPAQAGTQAHFRLTSQSADVDLGPVVITVDAAGDATEAVPTFSEGPAAGLELLAATDTSFAALTLPSAITALSWQSGLSPSGALVLARAFYQRASYPSAYGQALARFAFYDIRLKLAPSVNLYRAFISAGGNWLTAARRRTAPAQAPEDEALWQEQGFSLAALSAHDWRAQAYASRRPRSGQAIVVTIQLSNGQVFKIPRLLSDVVLQPPQLSAWAADAAALRELSYSDPAEENGLTRALPLGSSQLRALVKPPRDAAEAPYDHASMPFFSVSFDYFTTDPDTGAATPVSVTASDFPDAWQEATAVHDDLLQASGSWDPHSATLSYEWEAGSSTPADGDELSLLADYFLFAGDGALAVNQVRVRLRYANALGQQGECFFWVVPP